jgi:hypothetical protein
MLVAKSCLEFKQNKISVLTFAEKLYVAGTELCSYCDNKSHEEILGNYLCDLGYAIDDEIYVFSIKKAENYAKQYIDQIEKLVIRGTVEGWPITEKERIEWLEEQKQKEREEFYKINGYYEDE